MVLFDSSLNAYVDELIGFYWANSIYPQDAIAKPENPYSRCTKRRCMHVGAFDDEGLYFYNATQSTLMIAYSNL